MKLGVALGGGGAKGFAHIGVLEVLEQEGIEFEVVTGTSIGSLVGAAYAAGKLKEMSKKVTEIKLTDVPRLLSPTFSKLGFFSGVNALEMLLGELEVELIEELPKTFGAVSTDLYAATQHISTSGSLRDAVRASIAIPALFTPLILNGHVLVDGGLVEPVPTELARSLGADVLIAIDLFGPVPSTAEEKALLKAFQDRLWPRGIQSALSYLESVSQKLFSKDDVGSSTFEKPAHLVNVIESTLQVSQRVLTQYRLKEFPPDLLIQPALSAVGSLDFHRAEPVIEIGRRAALKHLEQIKRLCG